MDPYGISRCVYIYSDIEGKTGSRNTHNSKLQGPQSNYRILLGVQ